MTGGAEGTRTPDPLHAMQVRYQLRHSPGLCLSGRKSRRSNLISLMHFRPARQSAPAAVCRRAATAEGAFQHRPGNEKIRRNLMIPADYRWS